MEPRSTSSIVRCQIIGEFIDEAEGAANAPPGTPGVIEKTRMIGSFEERSESAPLAKPLHDFVVLLNNKERLTVRGSGLRYIPGGGDQREGGTYAVVVGTAGSETIVALLKQTEVIGIVPADAT